jgi:hypothetical protein
MQVAESGRRYEGTYGGTKVPGWLLPSLPHARQQNAQLLAVNVVTTTDRYQDTLAPLHPSLFLSDPPAGPSPLFVFSWTHPLRRDPAEISDCSPSIQQVSAPASPAARWPRFLESLMPAAQSLEPRKTSPMTLGVLVWVCRHTRIVLIQPDSTTAGPHPQCIRDGTAGSFLDHVANLRSGKTVAIEYEYMHGQAM